MERLSTQDYTQAQLWPYVKIVFFIWTLNAMRLNCVNN